MIRALFCSFASIQSPLQTTDELTARRALRSSAVRGALGISAGQRGHVAKLWTMALTLRVRLACFAPSSRLPGPATRLRPRRAWCARCLDTQEGLEGGAPAFSTRKSASHASADGEPTDSGAGRLAKPCSYRRLPVGWRPDHPLSAAPGAAPSNYIEAKSVLHRSSLASREDES